MTITFGYWIIPVILTIAVYWFMLGTEDPVEVGTFVWPMIVLGPFSFIWMVYFAVCLWMKH